MEDTTKLKNILDSLEKIKNKEVAVSVKRDNSTIKHIIKIHGEFAQMFSATIFECIVKFKLSRNDLLVLFGYCSLMEYGNAINISQQDVAQKIGIAQPNIARSIKKLKEVGIFYSTKSAPRSLYIHPAFIAKGDLAQFKDQIEKWEENRFQEEKQKLEHELSQKEKITNQTSTIQKEIELKKKELAQLELDLKSSKGETPF